MSGSFDFVSRSIVLDIDCVKFKQQREKHLQLTLHLTSSLRLGNIFRIFNQSIVKCLNFLLSSIVVVWLAGRGKFKSRVDWKKGVQADLREREELE